MKNTPAIIIILLLFSNPSFAVPDDIRPLKASVDIKGGGSIWLSIILILLFVAALFAFYYFRKRDVKKGPPAAARPPEEIAMEKLKSLLEMRLVEKGMVKEYYIGLSDIMRGYIEHRFRIFALDRTTWELYQEMRTKRIERSSVDKIRDFLEHCDLVKFAKYIPAQKEIEESYGKAGEIVEVTTPEKYAVC